MAAQSLKLLFSKAVKITIECSWIVYKSVLLLIKHHFHCFGRSLFSCLHFFISEMYMKLMEVSTKTMLKTSHSFNFFSAISFKIRTNTSMYVLLGFIACKNIFHRHFFKYVTLDLNELTQHHYYGKQGLF